MKIATRESVLEAYSEKIAAEIDAMSDDEVQAELESFDEGESLLKLAADQEALGRFSHIGFTGLFEDFDEAMKVANDDVAVAVQILEEDLVKHASEIEDMQAAQGLEEETLEDSAEKVAFEAAWAADPGAMKLARDGVLEAQGITLYEVDADGEPVAELALS